MREIRLLGTVKVECTDGPVPHFRSQRTIALLGYLAAERRTITRGHLAALFWPDDASKNAKGNLRCELHNLAQILPALPEEARQRLYKALDLDAFIANHAP